MPDVLLCACEGATGRDGLTVQGWSPRVGEAPEEARTHPAAPAVLLCAYAGVSLPPASPAGEAERDRPAALAVLLCACAGISLQLACPAGHASAWPDPQEQKNVGWERATGRDGSTVQLATARPHIVLWCARPMASVATDLPWSRLWAIACDIRRVARLCTSLRAIACNNRQVPGPFSASRQPGNT